MLHAESLGVGRTNDPTLPSSEGNELVERQRALSLQVHGPAREQPHRPLEIHIDASSYTLPHTTSTVCATTFCQSCNRAHSRAATPIWSLRVVSATNPPIADTI